MITSLVGTSQTLDEGVHVTAGYTFWRYNDYRLNPENGNLPQRVMALPLLFGHYQFVPAESDLWRTANKWGLTWQWLYQLGNNAEAMIQLGRACMGLLAVALGALVWAWARELFGPLGGMLSLLLYVFNPSILANGALMTSDTASALFFFAATWAWWRMLQRFTVARVLVSAVVMGGLFVSKMSAPLIVPVIFTLSVIRLIRVRPLPTRGLGLAELRGRRGQILAFAAAAACHGVIVLGVVWCFHGFRYSAFSPDLPASTWIEAPWEEVLNKRPPATLFEQVGLGRLQAEEVKRIFAREHADQSVWSPAALKAVAQVKLNVLGEEQGAHLDRLLAEPPPQIFPRMLETVRDHHWLPEAYIYGLAHVWRGARERAAFLNGDFSISGWRTFFPYTFLVKTPLSLFLVIALAVAAGVASMRARQRSVKAGDFAALMYDTSPLWVLFGFYWAAAILSHLNIGHRHILPTYPPLFVLCGMAVTWLGAWPGIASKPKRNYSTSARAAGIALCAAVALLAIEVCCRFPHYLAYFNGLVRPARAYRHLVDSSLDWGQDLPGVRRYIEKRHLTGPVYLSYYGFASPAYYHVPAILGYSVTSRTPPLQILTPPDGGESDAFLRDFFQREPEYDKEVVGSTLRDGVLLAVVVKKPDALRLTGGTYFISATLLQPVIEPVRGAFGPWNERLERQYQTLRQLVAPLFSDDATERSEALGRLPAENWIKNIESHEYLRFRRLTSFLRQREPDDSVGYSILVYHVSADELARALDGPPVELGRDILNELFPQQR
ncbi:MAG: glycosyltransferase family 39 protein [Chthoniobacterales bacterium]